MVTGRGSFASRPAAAATPSVPPIAPRLSGVSSLCVPHAAVPRRLTTFPPPPVRTRTAAQVQHCRLAPSGRAERARRAAHARRRGCVGVWLRASTSSPVCLLVPPPPHIALAITPTSLHPRPRPAGWLKTVDQYYYGSQNQIQVRCDGVARVCCNCISGGPCQRYPCILLPPHPTAPSVTPPRPQRAEVQNILDAVVKELAWNPDRTFICECHQSDVGGPGVRERKGERASVGGWE